MGSEYFEAEHRSTSLCKKTTTEWKINIRAADNQNTAIWHKFPVSARLYSLVHKIDKKKK